MINAALYRKRAGLTQKKLAARLGVDRTTISNWDSGKSHPRIDMLAKLAKELNCSPNDLINEPEPQPKTERTA